MTVSTNTWLPQTTGELQLRPGISIFQAMFSVVLHRSGSRVSSAATPARSPRNCGQFCACAVAEYTRAQSVEMSNEMRLVIGQKRILTHGKWPLIRATDAPPGRGPRRADFARWGGFWGPWCA